MSRSWRDIAEPIIHKVIKENESKSEKELKKAIRDAYPFGPRQYHPYKIWCDEVKIQTGKKVRKKNAIDENQQSLFN